MASTSRKANPLAKTKVKFRVSFTRKVLSKPEPGKEAELPEQQTFFCVDKASLIRTCQLLLWDNTLQSLYVDDHEGEVLSSLVR